MYSKITLFSLIFGLLLAGCAEQSETENDVFIYQNTLDINYGTDICSYSNEVIEKVRYGGKMVMEDGTVHKFMSVECTAGFYLGLDDRSSVQTLQIVDFAHGQQYLPADELVYLKSPLQPSPNGLYLTAIDKSNEKMKTYIYDAYPGTFYNWEEVLELVNDEWNLSRNLSHTTMH